MNVLRLGFEAFSGCLLRVDVQHEIYGLGGKFWLAAQLKIDPLDLAIGEPFMREDIAPLFGEAYNPGSWNVGHVVLPSKKAHILPVTINKQGRADAHKYMDHWIDGSHFHWQSQNAIDPSSKRGQEFIRHATLDIGIHLFVRENKLAAGKAAPFTYHGRVLYESHQGSQPMSVVLRLQDVGPSPLD